MIRADGSINEEFVRHVDAHVAAMHVDRDWIICGCTAAAAALVGCDPESLPGRPLDSLNQEPGVRERIRRAVEEGRLDNDRFTSMQPFKRIMKPVADEVGLCISWLWLIAPADLKLTRVLASLKRLPDASYGLLLSPLEDPTHRCFTRVDEQGRVEDDFGAALDRGEIELLDMFMSGRSYGQIAELLGLTPPMVKRRLNSLAGRMGMETPAQMRETIWNKHSEEFIIAPQSLVVGAGDALYRGALRP